MRLMIRGADRLYTCDDQDRVFSDAYLCVEDGRIAAVGSGLPPWNEADVVHDMAGCIVMPGFINVHHHFFQSLTRAVPIGQRTTSLDWMMSMYPLWAEYDVDAMYWSSRASAAEQLLSGATTSADHSNLHLTATMDSVEAQIAAAAEAGIRYHLVRGSLGAMEANLEERLRPLLGDHIDHLLGRGVDVLGLIEATLRRHHTRADGAMLDLSIGPGGITYGDPTYLKRHADLSRDYDCGLHTHYHPRPVEREISARRTGLAPLDYLAACGWLKPGTWLAHCTELTDHEIDQLATAGCAVSHSPRTIIRLGYRITRIAALRAAGIRVGIGVDGAASNDSGSMLGDLRLALLLHRAGHPDEPAPERNWLTPYQLLTMATRDGAAILRRPDIGRLAVGLRGDVAAFRMTGVAFAGAVADPLGALLMCGMDGHAELTVVNGRVRVVGGRLIDGSEDRIVQGANAAAERILARASARTGLDFSSYLTI